MGHRPRSWLEKITAVDRQRAKYQEMAAEELITIKELRERLAGLEETKKTAQGELESISLRPTATSGVGA